MAFPTTSVLDSFTRADENPLGTNWGNTPFSSGAQLKVVSNACTGAAAFGNQYWSASTFGPDTEVFWTITTIDRNTGCHFRLQSPHTTGVDGYEGFAGTGTGTTSFWRIDNEAETQLGANISTAWANGDQAGFEMIGTTITAYRNTGSGWSSLGTRTDGTYTGAGNIGLACDQTTARLDDFGGGTVAGGTVAGPPPLGAGGPELFLPLWDQCGVF